MRRGVVAVALLGALVVASSAWALLKETSLEDLISLSSMSVVATVEGTEVARIDETGELWTVVTLKPKTIVTGKGDFASLKVRVLGGKTPAGSQVVPDSPRYRDGEEVLAFLKPHDSFEGAWHTVGWRLGKFTIVDGFVKERNQPLEHFIATIHEVERGLDSKD